jgi:predicted  nucleic acid-binding Zn-ribbon protein
MLTEEEKRQLMGELEDLEGSEKAINEKVVELTNQTAQLESDINDIEDGLV